MPKPYDATGPHIHSEDSVLRTMLAIVIALLPLTVMATWLFGPWALYLVGATALASVLFEIPFAPGRFSARTPFGDGSALVAGMILGLSLPPTAPWWIPIVGAAVLVVFGKQVFGGLGNNIFNPALVSRAILILSWPRQINQWVAPFDGVTSATPLGGLDVGYLPMALGTIPGSLGETSAIALLVGAAVLVATKLINWRVPVSVIAGSIVASLMFGVDPLFTVLSGSLLFGAVFMATDMVTSPTGKTSHLIYGVGCGFLTVVIRTYTAYPEGITFAFLIMNGFAYLMDRVGADPIFGQVNERLRRVSRAATVVGAIGLTAVLVLAGIGGQERLGGRWADARLTRSVRRLFPDADRVIPVSSFDDAVVYHRVHQGRQPVGYVASTTTNGYGGPMRVEVSLSPDRVIRSVIIGEHRESPTIGSAVTAQGFLVQFEGYHQDSRTEIGDSVSAISGATISSRTVRGAIERILAALDEDTRRQGGGAPLPTAADGVHEGTGSGYHGPIRVEVTVEVGRVSRITVAGHSESAGIGTRAMDTLAEQIVSGQTLGVDGVSGATGTSDGFISAVENALGDN